MAASSQTVEQSFNILGYSLLFLGVYSFHVEPAKRTKLYRILQMIYCSIVTLIHSIVILAFISLFFTLFLKYLLYHNVNMIAYYISSIITYKACLVQRALFYWKSRDIIDYINDWGTFEIEYKSITGKKLNAVSFKKSLSIFFLSTLAIIFVTIMALIGEMRNTGPQIDRIYVLSAVIVVVIMNLMRLYTELMWYMFSDALRNAAVQLADDYTNELCQERGLDRSSYEYLWIKLAKLQCCLPLTLSKIYGYQLAINFLQLLFHGFVFFEFVFRYMTIDTLKKILLDPDEQFLYFMGLYGPTTISFVYLWLGATTAGSAQKALVDDTKRKLLGIISDNAQNNSAFQEQILITWVNYMIILIQFKISFYEEDKDETIKKTGRNKRSVQNVDSIKFQNYVSFLDFENMKMNMSASLPLILDWYSSLSSYN